MWPVWVRGCGEATRGLFGGLRLGSGLYRPRVVPHQWLERMMMFCVSLRALSLCFSTEASSCGVGSSPRWSSMLAMSSARILCVGPRVVVGEGWGEPLTLCRATRGRNGWGEDWGEPLTPTLHDPITLTATAEAGPYPSPNPKQAHQRYFLVAHSWRRRSYSG